MSTGLVPRTWRAVEQVMGLPVSLALRGRHAGGPVAEEAWATVMTELRRVDAGFSTYRADSWVSRLDRGELDPAQCPPEVGEVLALGEAARVASGGAFDVWRLDASGRRRLDPSGVVKGWAVQRAARLLTWLPDTDVCLGAGGDLVCRTADPDGVAWQVGVEDPHDPTRLLARVPVTRGAVATSGSAHRGAHVLDARTGLPAQGLAQVTVVADDLVTADVDATAAYALGHDGESWLRARGRTAVVVTAAGRAVVVSPG